jgi:hypothetical protein
LGGLLLAMMVEQNRLLLAKELWALSQLSAQRAMRWLEVARLLVCRALQFKWFEVH